MKRRIKIIPLALSTIFLYLLSPLTHAAVVASVSSTKVAKGEVFLLKIVSDSRADSDEIDFSSLENDFYMGRPSFGSSFNSINGKHQTRSEWTVSLAPQKAGTMTIPSFEVAGEHTDPISIVSTIDPSTPNSAELVSYQSKLSKSEVYPGELVRLDTRLIIKADARRIQNPQLVPPTSTSGLEIEPIGDAKQYTRVIDGIESTIVEQSYQVRSNLSGQYSFTGPKITATLLDTRNTAGATRLIPIDTEQEEFSVTVLDKPTDYSGIWLPSPNLTLSQNWLDESGEKMTGLDNNTVTAGSPVTRQISLVIEGVSQSQLPSITVDYPNDIRYYDETPQITQDGNKVTMTLKHVLIPKKSGETSLPPISLNWWDTINKTMRTETLSGLDLIVEESDTPNLILEASSSLVPEVVTETITVKDAGLWPYLTGFFALLWLFSTALLFKNRNKHKTIVQNTSVNNNFLADLVSAIKQRDGFKVQSCLAQWYKQNKQLSSATKQQINSEIDEMMASIYSGSPSSWQEKKLINTLKKADKVKRNKRDNRQDLATL
jgi:hypothetical protein